MKRLKVGLNGFGRIGRAFTRIASHRNSFDIVQINTRKGTNDMMAYLLQYDSIYRKFDIDVKATETGLQLKQTLQGIHAAISSNSSVTIATTLSDDPTQIPWEQHDVDVVIDATGAFTKTEDLQKHIHGTVKKVILTAPAKDDMPHVVLGVNDDKIDWANTPVISNASCTTNCASPMFKVLHDNFGVVSGSLTTAHAYTLTQSLLDDAGKDTERSRAAALNIIPSTTGAAKAIVKTIPELTGKIDGMAIRVPVPTVSFSDITVVTEKTTTIEEVNAAFKKASEENMKGYLAYEKNILVSSDYIGSTYSCIFDANYTKVINGNFVKVYGWYDNEWAYSTRLVDLVEKLSEFF